MSESIILVQKLAEQLRLRHLTVATAESCTGGLIAGLLTDIPGSSLWFERGFVTYSNEAKQEMLGVKSELIVSHGAVSKEVAEAMALGALSHSYAHLALAVTGIAGPDGGTQQKPVGTVWFAWVMRNEPVRSLHCCFHNTSRQEVRQFACNQALKGAIAYLEQKNQSA